MYEMSKAEEAAWEEGGDRPTGKSKDGEMMCFGEGESGLGSRGFSGSGACRASCLGFQSPHPTPRPSQYCLPPFLELV